MKRSLLILLMLLVCGLSTSQAKDRQDSLAIDQMLSKSKQAIRNKRYSEAAKLAADAYAYDANGEYPDLVAQALLLRGKAMLKLGASSPNGLVDPNTLNFLMRARQKLKVTSLIDERVECDQLLAEYYVTTKVDIKALQYYEEAVNVPETTPSLSLLQGYAGTLKRVKQFEKAAEIYKRVLDKMARGAAAGQLLSTLKSLVDLEREAKNWNQAIIYAKRLLKAQDVARDTSAMATTYNDIGYLYRYAGKNDSSLAYFNKSIALKRGKNTNAEIESYVRTLLNSGSIHLELNEYEEADAQLNEALALAKKINNGELEARTIGFLAASQSLQAEFDQSLRLYNAAIDKAVQARKPELLPEFYEKLSLLLVRVDDYKRALGYKNKSTEINDSLKQRELERLRDQVAALLKSGQSEQAASLSGFEDDMRMVELKRQKLEKQVQQEEARARELKEEAEAKQAEISRQMAALENASKAQKAELQQQIEKNKQELIEINKKQKEAEERVNQAKIQLQSAQEESNRAQEDALKAKQAKKNAEDAMTEAERAKNFSYLALILFFGFIVASLIAYIQKRKDAARLETQAQELERQRTIIEQSYNNVRLLSDIGREITSHLSLEKVGDAVYNSINTLMDATGFGFGVYEADENKLYFPGFFERGEKMKPFHFDVNDTTSFVTYAVRANKEVILLDFEQDANSYPEVTYQNKVGIVPASAIVLPLTIGDKKIGVILVESDAKNAYGENEINLMRNLAVSTAVALDNSRAYDKVKAVNDALSKTLKDLQQAQSQLVQSEKMASLGQLTAGVAHEINNPVNFISGGIESLRTNFEEILEVVDAYSALKGDDPELAEKLQKVNKLKRQLEFDDLVDEAQLLLKSIKNGASRTAEIVKGLRNFSRLDEDALKKANLEEGLETTLIMLRNKIKDKVEVVQDFGNIPEIDCFPGPINQVFMNIIGNAAQAIDEKGTITITTRTVDDMVMIAVRDTGAGMSSETKQRIFEPFFTTKPVGEGTGLGLSITFGIIEKHNGRIEVESELGVGTEFKVFLPIVQKQDSF